MACNAYAGWEGLGAAGKSQQCQHCIRGEGGGGSRANAVKFRKGGRVLRGSAQYSCHYRQLLSDILCVHACSLHTRWRSLLKSARALCSWVVRSWALPNTVIASARLQAEKQLAAAFFRGVGKNCVAFLLPVEALSLGGVGSPHHFTSLRPGPPVRGDRQPRFGEGASNSSAPRAARRAGLGCWGNYRRFADHPPGHTA